jgi:ABC-2 type transport system permease protein
VRPPGPGRNATARWRSCPPNPSPGPGCWPPRPAGWPCRWPLGLLYGALALTVGILTGDKRLTIAITAGIAGLSFVLSVFLPLADSLKTLAKINLWYPHSANVALVNGIDPGYAAVLAGTTIVISTIGFLVLPRRDLRG